MCWRTLWRFGGKECELDMIKTCFFNVYSFQKTIKMNYFDSILLYVWKLLIHMNISICQNCKICWLKVTWGHAKSPLFMPANTVLSLLAFILISQSNIWFRNFRDSLRWKCLGYKLLWERLWVRWIQRQAFYSLCIRWQVLGNTENRALITILIGNFTIHSHPSMYLHVVDFFW